MGYTARFERGSQSIDLNGSDYTLSPDFLPPATGMSYQLGGSGRNIGGMTMTGKVYADRQMAFTILVYGTTSTESHILAARLQSFLLNLSKTEKTYFAYRPDSAYTFEPVWGQRGALIRWEIKNAQVSIGNEYLSADVRSNRLFLYVVLTVAPYGTSAKQRLATGTGGIISYRAGMSDTPTRGLVIEQAGTNKMTNPIYGHATWNTNWSAGASLSATQNTKKEYIWTGSSSAKLVRKASVAWSWTQSINVGNTNTHTLSAYVKKKDGSAVTDSDIGIWYGSGKTTTVVGLGNGWYLIHSSFAGIASATTAGVIPNVIGQEIYVGGVQLEEKAYPTPLIYGNQLDCSWAGTAHESTSTRTAAEVKVPTADILNLGGGTIRVVWQPRVASTNDRYQDNSAYLFDDSGGTGFRAGWRHTTEVWFFNDGTNEATSATSQTFSSGQAIVFHMVWSSAGLAIYKNGSVLDTDATYTPPTFGALLAIGHSISPSNHIGGIFQGFTIFDRAMSATQVAADYAEVYPLSSMNMRVDWMPVLWTDDGDNVVDNCLDSTRENYAVAIDIPGDVEAGTIARLTSSQILTNGDAEGMFLNHLDTKEFISWSDMYVDLGGSADAAASGGSVAPVSISPGIEAIGFASVYLSKHTSSQVSGKQVNIILRAKETGSNLQLNNIVAFGVGNYYQTEYVSVTFPSTNFTHKLAPSSSFYDTSYWQTLETTQDANFAYVYASGQRTSGTANLIVDYYWRAFGNLLIIDFETAVDLYSVILDSTRRVVYPYDSTGLVSLKFNPNTIELVPENWNYLATAVGINGGSATVATTITHNSVDVIPRWGLV